MNTIDKELEKNGIKIIRPLTENETTAIATYVANSLCSSFPTLKLNCGIIHTNIFKIPMYMADMPNNMADASYYYKSSSIYFRNGMDINQAKKLALHECIHHFQEIKDSKGKLHRLGLCTYVGSKAYGNAINEAAVQLMTAFASNEKRDNVTYYGVTFPSDSPTYYPVLCNLIKQLGYLLGFSTLFDSTFYSNDIFFNEMKNIYGESNAYNIQENFEEIMALEEKVISISSRIQFEDLKPGKFKSLSNKMAKYKNKIQKIFFTTQNNIFEPFFDKQFQKIGSISQIENFRRFLYSYSTLIGSSTSYLYFNDYYISKISKLDELYEKMTKNSLAIVKESAISKFISMIKGLFTSKAKVVNVQPVQNNYSELDRMD